MFKELILWGDVNEIAVNPPTIVIEVFDKDIGVLNSMYCLVALWIQRTAQNCAMQSWRSLCLYVSPPPSTSFPGSSPTRPPGSSPERGCHRPLIVEVKWSRASLAWGEFLWDDLDQDHWSDESLFRVDSSVHLIYHDPSDLGSLILIRIISKERTPGLLTPKIINGVTYVHYDTSFNDTKR